MPGAFAQAGIPMIGLIASRHNVTCVSMTPFLSAEIYAKSTCYHRCAYAPQTRALRWLRFPSSRQSCTITNETTKHACSIQVRAQNFAINSDILALPLALVTRLFHD